MGFKEDSKKNYHILLIVAAIITGWSVFIYFQDDKLFAAEEADTTPPKIYNISNEIISPTSTKIYWDTNENSDSLVNYGLDTNYGMARQPDFDKKKHEISLENLLPNKTYYFRVTSADNKGNQGISSDFTFTTPKIEEEGGFGGTGEGKGLYGTASGTGYGGTESGQGWGGTEEGNKGWEKNGENQLTEIIQKIEQIPNEQILEQVLETVQTVAQEKAKPPIITIDLAKVEVGTDWATITWGTDKPANTVVSLVSDAAYDANKTDPYAWSEGNSNELVTEHAVTVNGLQPATIYHYQVSSKSALGLTGKSGDGMFRTEAIAPEILSLRIGKVEEHSVTILWTTNVPTNELVEYTNLVTNKTKLDGNSAFFTYHSVQLTELEFDTPYRATIKVENEYGKKAESNPIYFTTVKDEIPPVVSKVATESTLYPGDDNKVQTIITWLTDEPAVCQLYYQRGLDIKDISSLAIETDYVLKHVNVAVNFLPGTVYKFWIKCQDPVKNEVTSKDFSMLTPSQEKSILDIIISNLESSFGWVKKMKFGSSGG